MINVITDEECVREFVLHDSIWEKISDDMHDISNYTPDMDDLWLAVVEAGVIIGMCSFSLVNSITVQIHPHFPDKWKGKGRNGIIECIDWIKKQAVRRIDKINATIPTCYRSVYNCAKRIGFKDEGVSKSCFLKGDKVYDQYYLGLELKRWEAKDNGKG
jgi:RimJ/RimL family protein N-acetyltransferase